VSIAPRHRCLIYQGPPSRHLPALAAVVRQQLHEGNRCLYLDSPPMVSGMGSYLAAAGVDVAHEVAQGSLLLSSDRPHLTGLHFDVERMINQIERAVSASLADGYQGLWASGDMGWELGPEQDFTKLLEYEWRLEEMFFKYPGLCGICQYHSETLPRDAMRQGLMTHASIFVNETLSRINPYYTRGKSPQEMVSDSDFDAVVSRLNRVEDAN
jgi:hypothetical protein